MHSNPVHPASSQDSGASPRILIIRRDNIGDLACTTPAIAALRERYPKGRLVALVNTYNEAVLTGNPNLDAVYAYEKGKHRGARSLVSVYADRVRMILALRREKLDYAILATPGFSAHALRHARLVGARHVLGYAAPGKAHAQPDIALPYDRDRETHEVERVFGLLRALGIQGSPPPMRVFPDPGEVGDLRTAISTPGTQTPVIGVHVSARRPNQQWPVERYAELIKGIATRYAARILLLWSPGEADNPMHPGDDAKANEIARLCADTPLFPCATQSLSRLIAALAVCERVVCTDGGAMHLAAALGKPILCFFGDSSAARWRPWKVPHELLQPPTRNLKDLGVGEAFDGFERLLLASPFGPVPA